MHALIGPGGDYVLRLDFADLSDHSAADIGGLALSKAKSHWHGACILHTRAYTQPFVLKEVGGKRELVEASSRGFPHVLWLKVHCHWLLRACLFGIKRETTTSSLSGPTWTSLCGVPSKRRSVPWHHVHL